MAYVVLVLFIAVEILLFWAWRRHKAVSQPQPQPAQPAAAEAGAPAAAEPSAVEADATPPAIAPEGPEPEAPCPDGEADALDELLATATLEPPPLDVHLQKLGRAIEAAGANAAHPRELAEHPQFKDAVAVLTDPDVEIETVTQYATGANWALACAALAARADGAEPVDEVMAHFDKLAPWAMYFAFIYFSTSIRGRRSARRRSVPRTGGRTIRSSPRCFATISAAAPSSATLPNSAARSRRRRRPQAR